MLGFVVVVVIVVVLVKSCRSFSNPALAFFELGDHRDNTVLNPGHDYDHDNDNDNDKDPDVFSILKNLMALSRQRPD